MKNKENRWFVWTSEAWYSKQMNMWKNEICFGGMDSDNANHEMQMVWELLDNELVPQLNVCDDAWGILALFNDLIQELAKIADKNITQEQFVEILISCGFKDKTKYNKPDRYEMEKQLTEDEKIFGHNQLVYCSQHLRPHETGWCTISARDKVGLGISYKVSDSGICMENYKKAVLKCKALGLKVVE